MNMNTNNLFTPGNINDSFMKLHSVSESLVDEITVEDFRCNSDADIVDQVFSRLEVFPLQIPEDKNEMQMESQEVEISTGTRHRRFRTGVSSSGKVHGTQLVINIPFTGTTWLWNCQPSTFRTNSPRGNPIPDQDSNPGTLQLVIIKPTREMDDTAAVSAEVDKLLEDIRWNLVNVLKDVSDYNTRLRNYISMYVEQRRGRIGTHESLESALGIPIVRRPGTPDFKELPVKRRIVQPLKHIPDQPPEPGINSEVYELILDAIRHQGCTFETTRGTYFVHGEEDLRNIILANLNQYFQGDATGETFRKYGKTDIRIEDEDRMAFIGECKVWSGPGDIHGDIDQLLGYSTWRDCKTALVYFNKTVAGFKAIQDKMEPALADHPNYIRPLPVDKAGEWRFKIRSTEDAGREINVHVFLFDLFVKPEDKDDGEVS